MSDRLSHDYLSWPHSYHPFWLTTVFASTNFHFQTSLGLWFPSPARHPLRHESICRLREDRKGYRVHFWTIPFSKCHRLVSLPKRFLVLGSCAPPRRKVGERSRRRGAPVGTDRQAGVMSPACRRERLFSIRFVIHGVFFIRRNDGHLWGDKTPAVCTHTAIANFQSSGCSVKADLREAAPPSRGSMRFPRLAIGGYKPATIAQGCFRFIFAFLFLVLCLFLAIPETSKLLSRTCLDGLRLRTASAA